MCKAMVGMMAATRQSMLVYLDDEVNRVVGDPFLRAVIH